MRQRCVRTTSCGKESVIAQYKWSLRFFLFFSCCLLVCQFCCCCCLIFCKMRPPIIQNMYKSTNWSSDDAVFYSFLPVIIHPANTHNWKWWDTNKQAQNNTETMTQMCGATTETQRHRGTDNSVSIQEPHDTVQAFTGDAMSYSHSSSRDIKRITAMRV